MTRVKAVACLGAFLLSTARASQPHYFVTALAGNPPSLTAPVALNQPKGASLIVAYDPQGHLYYGNGGHIWRLNADGTDTLIAGSFSSSARFVEGEPAVDTVFQGFVDLKFDSVGNLYIADTAGNKIYKVTPDGAIRTFAGTGSSGNGTLPATGPNVPASSVPFNTVTIAIDANDNVYAQIQDSPVPNTVCWGVISFPPDGSSSSVVATANTGSCNGGLVQIAVAGSQLFLAGTTGNFVMTIPGSPSQQASPLPSSLVLGTMAVAPNGWLYNLTRSGLSEVNPQGLEVEPVPDSGAITSGGSGGSMAVNPITGDVAFGAESALVLTVLTGNLQMVCCDAPSFSGDGGPASLAIMSAGALVADAAGDLYVADAGNARIRKITPDGIINTIAGNGASGSTGDGGMALQAGISPGAMALDGAGNLYFINTSSNTIRKIDTHGGISTVAGGGTSKLAAGVAGLSASINPTVLACDSAGDLSSDGTRQVFELNTSGTLSLVAGTGTLAEVPSGTPALDAGIGGVTAIAFDHSGAVYIGDKTHQVIWKIDAQGNLDLVAGVEVLQNDFLKQLISAGPATSVDIFDPYNILLDAQGNLYFYDDNLVEPPQILMVDTSGNLWPIGGGGGSAGGDGVDAAVATLGVNGLANDGSGNIYVSGGNDIRKLSPYNPASPPPFLSQGGVVGAGGSVPAVQAVSAGGEVSIFGGNFVSAADAHTLQASDLVGGKVPTMLAGVCASFGGAAAAILGVYPNQLNAQVGALTPGAVNVQVTANCGTPQAVTSNYAGVVVQTASPEFYSFAPDPIGGHNPVAAVNAVTGAYVGPPGLLSGATTAPAKAGDIVQAYGTGFGATTPSFGLGVIPAVAGNLNAPYLLTLGGVAVPAANIEYAGISPCCAGFYQFDFTVPAGTAAGNQPLVITVGGVSSPSGAYLAVQ